MDPRGAFGSIVPILPLAGFWVHVAVKGSPRRSRYSIPISVLTIGRASSHPHPVYHQSIWLLSTLSRQLSQLSYVSPLEALHGVIAGHTIVSSPGVSRVFCQFTHLLFMSAFCYVLMCFRTPGGELITPEGLIRPRFASPFGSAFCRRLFINLRTRYMPTTLGA